MMTVGVPCGNLRRGQVNDFVEISYIFIAKE
jgi:hypothetical protein